MKQSLTREERDLLVAYRLQRATETLAEADKLIEGAFYNAAVNRLYYACYYAVTALLIRHNITAQTHHGVKQMFSLHFIVSSRIDRQYGAFYGRLFNDRMSGDYDDFVHYDYEMIAVLRPQAESFMAAVQTEITAS